MKYVKLGRTGLDVSRDLPRVHELRRARASAATRGRSTRRRVAPVLPPGARGRHQLLRHRQRVLGGHRARSSLGRALRRARREPRRGRDRDQGARRDAARARTASGCRARRSSTEVDHSLRRLGTDYIDLYQIHRLDRRTPIEETLEALHDVVHGGQGALPRRVVDVGVAVRQGAAPRRGARLDAVRQHAGPLQPPQPRGGAGDAARSAPTRASA